MWAQLGLQLMFPKMFFREASIIPQCILATILCHVFIVEPLYYAVHRWLHVPDQMKSMHGFHHMSINTVPSTSLVQNFQEHFIYIATFGPAMFVPYFTIGMQHWTVIGAYLILFDLVNAFGHTNIRCRHWIFESKWSPIRYLFYTPEFHLGHHYFYNKNFALFMPIWDHLFSTYKDYKKKDAVLLPASKQDFVFIGHNGGLGHLLTVPEMSVYNVYDKYTRTWLPIELELLLVNCVNHVIFRAFSTCYSLSRYLVDNKHVGRVICVLRTPIDYATPANYPAINREIVALMREQYKSCGTRYFGLGNLNKMKQLNDGGAVIAEMVKSDSFLKDKKIRVWTGDTLTTASVFNQMMAIPKLEKVFYVGATGKIGKAVCQLLLEKGIKIRVFSSYEAVQHPNISYTKDMKEMSDYKYVLIGKLLKPSCYKDVLKKTSDKHQVLLDYTVPFMPLRGGPNQHHIQIGVLKATNDSFLRGHFDVCMGTDQNHIYPCHAGCIINMVEKREEDETGDIDLVQVNRLWKKALGYGLVNKEIDLQE